MASYKPGLPQHNDNVSHESPVKEFITLLSGVLLLIFIVYWLLGLAVDYAAERLSYEHEAQLFEKLPVEWGDMLGDSPEPDARLQALVDDLQKCSTLPVKITVSKLSNKAPNAVAIPGGNMFVFQGLLDHVQSENGLAFVLAHELGHFINHDHTKGLGRGIVLMTLASMLTGPNSSISRLLTPSIELNTANFSQERESKADETALEILSCHYGHLAGATEFFESLKDMDQGDSGLNHYFSSHPQVEKRIQAILQWNAEHQIPEGKTIAW
jgi:Zn-dependent protease with chaperone function